MRSDLDIGWMVPEDLDIASYRYRAMIPMRELRRRGLRVSTGVARVTVFQKHWEKLFPNIARKLKNEGGKVVFDMSDDKFGGRYDEIYREMISLADVVTVPTDALQDRVQEETGVIPVIITDPYEYPQCAPQMPSGRPLNLLWFGHSTNLNGLREVLPRLSGYNILAVSKGDIPEGVKSMHWSREAMMQAFSWCDAVIIPISEEDKNAVKSPNRMVEAIRQGRYVVANRLSSYAPYGMWQGDIVEGLEWARDNHEKALAAVSEAQPLVEAIHAPTTIGEKWYHTLTALLPEREVA